MSSYTYSSKEIKNLIADARTDRDFCYFISVPTYKDVVTLVLGNNCKEFEGCEKRKTVEKFINLYTDYLRRNFEVQLSSNTEYFEKYEVEICDIEDVGGVGSIIDTKKYWYFYEMEDANKKFNDIVETLNIVGANNIGVYINIYLYDRETLLSKRVNPNGTLAATEYLAGLKL